MHRGAEAAATLARLEQRVRLGRGDLAASCAVPVQNQGPAPAQPRPTAQALRAETAAMLHRYTPLGRARTVTVVILRGSSAGSGLCRPPRHCGQRWW